MTGKWTAVKVEEEQKPLGVNPQQIQLIFSANGQYQYNSTLNYQEAGTYYIDYPYLYTTDTLNTDGTKKVVEITQLLSDSLSIKMNERGKIRTVIFKKSDL